LPGALPQLHLKEPILRSDEALSEKQIVLIARIDVSDSPAIALHPYQVMQARDLLGSADHRDAPCGELLAIGDASPGEGCADDGGDNHNQQRHVARAQHP
jgi:hypothetical protein